MPKSRTGSKLLEKESTETTTTTTTTTTAAPAAPATPSKKASGSVSRKKASTPKAKHDFTKEKATRHQPSRASAKDIANKIHEANHPTALPQLIKEATKAFNEAHKAVKKTKKSKGINKKKTTKRSAAKPAAKAAAPKKRAAPKDRSKAASTTTTTTTASTAAKPTRGGSVAKKSAGSGPRIAGAKNEYVWQYKGNDAKWANYDAKASDVVEEVYQGYKANRGDTDVRAVKSGDWEYQVDFLAMKQTNTQHDAHRIRDIRRIPNDSSKPIDE